MKQQLCEIYLTQVAILLVCIIYKSHEQTKLNTLVFGLFQLVLTR